MNGNQLNTKKLVLEIADEELKQKSAFIELLDVVKQIIPLCGAYNVKAF